MAAAIQMFRFDEGSAAIAYADSNLIFRYENGLVILIEATPAGYKEKGQFEIPKASPLSWPYPAIALGKLFLRDQDRLLVYDIKSATPAAKATDETNEPARR